MKFKNFLITELIAECRYERNMRITVYARQVAMEKMSRAKADLYQSRLNSIEEVLIIVQEQSTIDVVPSIDLKPCVIEAKREIGWRKRISMRDKKRVRMFEAILEILEHVKIYAERMRNPQLSIFPLVAVLFVLFPFFGFAQSPLPPCITFYHQTE